MSRIVIADEQSAFDTAQRVLESDGLVIFPTDTVYGVGAAVRSPKAVARLYLAKGRPIDRPIPVLVSNSNVVERLAEHVDPISSRLMERFWPGPLTIVLPAQPWLPTEIVRDTGSVGVRMPDHPVAIQIIDRSGGALATTSANRSGEKETLTAADAARDIGQNVDLVVDGGTTPGGVPSTVVRIEPSGDLTVLRQGAISRDELLTAAGIRS